MRHLRLFSAGCFAVLLSGCGSGGSHTGDTSSSRFRSASPLTFSMGQQPHEMTVWFSGLVAQTRGQVRVFLQPTFDAAGFGGDDTAETEPLYSADPRKTVRFYDLTPGTYHLEAHDSDNTLITRVCAGQSHHGHR